MAWVPSRRENRRHRQRRRPTSVLEWGVILARNAEFPQWQFERGIGDWGLGIRGNISSLPAVDSACGFAAIAAIRPPQAISLPRHATLTSAPPPVTRDRGREIAARKQKTWAEDLKKPPGEQTRLTSLGTAQRQKPPSSTKAADTPTVPLPLPVAPRSWPSASSSSPPRWPSSGRPGATNSSTATTTSTSTRIRG